MVWQETESAKLWKRAIDLLLEFQDGRVVVIAHKSAPIRREHCAKRVLHSPANLNLPPNKGARTGKNSTRGRPVAGTTQSEWYCTE